MYHTQYSGIENWPCEYGALSVRYDADVVQSSSSLGSKRLRLVVDASCGISSRIQRSECVYIVVKTYIPRVVRVKCFPLFCHVSRLTVPWSILSLSRN